MEVLCRARDKWKVVPTWVQAVRGDGLGELLNGRMAKVMDLACD